MQQMSWYEFFKMAALTGFATTGIGMLVAFGLLRLAGLFDEWLKGLMRSAMLDTVVKEAYGVEGAKFNVRFNELERLVKEANQLEIARLDARYSKLENIVEEVKRVTHAAESIKTDMAQGNWDRQTRYIAKKELYVNILTTLQTAEVHFTLMLQLESNNGLTEQKSLELADQINNTLIKLNHCNYMSRLICRRGDIPNLLDTFRLPTTTDGLPNLIESVQFINKRFIELARQDLSVSD